MKKKFTLEITNPCSENFDKMIASTSGSFCSSCAKNVIDLSRKTNSEVARFIAETKDKNICARLKVTQLEEEFEYNEVSKRNNFKYAAAIAASVLLTSNVDGQDKTPVKTEVNATKGADYKLGKVIQNQKGDEEVSITIQGKLLDVKTNKPLNKQTYPNLILSINGSESASEINPKTGAFLIPITVLKNSKTLSITVTGGDYYLSKTIAFDIKKVKQNVVQQNIMIAAEELSKIQIMGGLGINYSEKKITKETL